MRIAVFHDFMDKKGGGERLVINMCRMLGADLYTGFIEPEKTFSTEGIRIIPLGKKPLMPSPWMNAEISRRFGNLDVSGMYDLYIFSGSWCISAVSTHRPNMLYMHTPPRFMYDLSDYYMKTLLVHKRFMLARFIKKWKPINAKYIRQFGMICPNSVNVRRRIEKYYGIRKSCVVYTGIDMSCYKWRKDRGYYLSSSRLDALKRIDIIIEAFKQMPGRKLKITGTGHDRLKIMKLAHGCKNIEFTGSVTDSEMKKLYSECKAVICASIDEDLGLAPIEASASGKPTLAVKEGGFLETVTENRNGLFFKPEPASLVKCIEKSEKKKWNPKQIRKSAEKFSLKQFEKRIRKCIDEIIEN